MTWLGVRSILIYFDIYEPARSREGNKLWIQDSNSKSQSCIMQNHEVLSRAKDNIYSFQIQMWKNPIQWESEWEGESNTEKGRMLTCLQAAAESPGVSVREGEWHASEKRGRHSGVSQHTAPGPMAEWCFRDKAEAYKPCFAPQGPLLPCLLSFLPPFHALHRRENKRRRTRCETQGVT